MEWKSRSSTSSQVPLDKAVDYGKGDGDYGDYCELDDVQRQFSSGTQPFDLSLHGLGGQGGEGRGRPRESGCMTGLHMRVFNVYACLRAWVGSCISVPSSAMHVRVL